MGRLVGAIARPAYAARRVKEVGIGRLAGDLLVKRAKLPIGFVGPALRAARIAAGAGSYLQRRSAARRFIAEHGNPLAIPEDAGHRRVQAEELPAHAAALQHCRDLFARRRALLERFPDSYGINLFAEDGLTWSKAPLDLRPHTPVLDLALDPRLVAAAAGYIGEMPVLTSVQLYCTTERQTFSGNNHFHFDKDFRQVKFWMAVEPIEPENGPFTFIDATKSKEVRRKAGYHGRLSDDRVYAAVSPEHQAEFLGAPGSMLLVDTCRCVHFGSRTRRGPRVMLLLQYQSPYAWFENVFYFQPVLVDQARYGRDPVARLVLAQLREKVSGRR